MIDDSLAFPATARHTSRFRDPIATMGPLHNSAQLTLCAAEHPQVLPCPLQRPGQGTSCTCKLCLCSLPHKHRPSAPLAPAPHNQAHAQHAFVHTYTHITFTMSPKRGCRGLTWRSCFVGLTTPVTDDTTASPCGQILTNHTQPCCSLNRRCCLTTFFNSD